MPPTLRNGHRGTRLKPGPLAIAAPLYSLGRVDNDLRYVRFNRSDYVGPSAIPSRSSRGGMSLKISRI
jgi:hypothetical protein